MFKVLNGITLCVFASTLFSCNNDAGGDTSANDSVQHIIERPVTYTADGVTMNGLVIYDSNMRTKAPGVLVVHEWWGLNDYAKSRARQLAEMGYVAMAVDMYGGGQQADNPELAQQLAEPFYNNPYLAYSRLQAAIKTIKDVPVVNEDELAAIGFCYGGFVVLNAAKAGADLAGVVSFHGGLAGLPVKKDSVQAEILVLHGGNDPFVPDSEVEAFKTQMDSAGVAYTFKEYDGATHAFTNPGATEMGKKYKMPIAYNETAEKRAWQEMKDFLNRIFY